MANINMFLSARPSQSLRKESVSSSWTQIKQSKGETKAEILSGSKQSK